MAHGQTVYKANFPVHLSTLGSKHYRHAAIPPHDPGTVTTGFRTPEQIAHWLLRHGPVRIRFRWHLGMWTVNAGTGRAEVVGTKQARVSCLFVGFDSDEPSPFRLLTPHGSGYGQIGRVWLSRDGVARLLKEGAIVDAPEL